MGRFFPISLMQEMHWKKYVAEVLGTGVLTLAVLASLAYNLSIATPFIAGLTLALFVYAIGPVSGAHINPAVTAGLWSIGKIGSAEAVKYIIAQIVGALAAMVAFESLLGPLPTVNAASATLTLVAEAAGAFLLLFGICAVVYEKARAGASGLVIGGFLLLGILIATPVSNGVLNPDVAIGIGSYTWAYIVGPVLGAAAACWLYRWLVTEHVG